MNPRNPHSWHEYAACRDYYDPDVFHPDGTTGRSAEQITEAKAVCRRCPVREDCLQWGMAEEKYGIYGGLTEWERQALKRRERDLAAAVAAEAAEHRAVLERELDAFDADHGRGRPSRDRWRETPQPVQSVPVVPVPADEAARNRALLEAELKAVGNRGRPSAA